MFGVLLGAELPNRAPGWEVVLLLLPPPPPAAAPPAPPEKPLTLGNSVFGAAVLGVPAGVEGPPNMPVFDCDPKGATLDGVKENVEDADDVPKGAAFVVPAPPPRIPPVAPAGCPDGLLSLSLFVLLPPPPPPAPAEKSDDIRCLRLRRREEH